jgi:hypothetical protein
MSMRFIHSLGGRVILALALLPALAAHLSAEEKSEFLRFVDDGRGGGKLEAAVATYRNAEGVTVHLVSAVHVAEPAYYRELNRAFGEYDAVLYEMIKPRGAPPPRSGAAAGGTVATGQRMLKMLLELDFQLDAVDYTPRHFVHADLDTATFFRMQRERGESFATLMLSALLQELARGPDGRTAPEIGMGDVLLALQAPDRARQFKLMLARQFQDMDRLLAGVDGPNGSVLLTERNKRAIEVLERTMGQGRKNIAIFFGAAHMADIEQRLLALGGFEKVEKTWQVAWDMSAE